MPAVGLKTYGQRRASIVVAVVTSARVSGLPLLLSIIYACASNQLHCAVKDVEYTGKQVFANFHALLLP